ncbi:hypothetical protein ACERII_07395 [Evansella sp. AB-rgal1]|uniref:hypothetical protein n=1 Tax=Evansella sp. AB-rgal1 TaxID=3242696 RepID=UPI00359E512C
MGKQLLWATCLFTIGFLSYFTIEVVRTYLTDDGETVLHNQNTKIIARSPIGNSSSTIFTLRNNVLNIRLLNNEDTKSSIKEMKIYKLDGLSRMVYSGNGDEILLNEASYVISLHPGRYTVSVRNQCIHTYSNSDCSYKFEFEVTVDGDSIELDHNEAEYRTFIHRQLRTAWELELEGYTIYEFTEFRVAYHLNNLKALYNETIMVNLSNGDILPRLYINGTHAFSYVLRGNGSFSLYEFRFYPGDLGEQWYLTNTEHLPPVWNEH